VHSTATVKEFSAQTFSASLYSHPSYTSEPKKTPILSIPFRSFLPKPPFVHLHSIPFEHSSAAVEESTHQTFSVPLNSDTFYTWELLESLILSLRFRSSLPMPQFIRLQSFPFVHSPAAVEESSQHTCSMSLKSHTSYTSQPQESPILGLLCAVEESPHQNFSVSL